MDKKKRKKRKVHNITGGSEHLFIIDEHEDEQASHKGLRKKKRI